MEKTTQDQTQKHPNHTTLPVTFCPFCLDPDVEGDPATREIMAGQRCNEPGCKHDHEHLLLTTPCHFEAGMSAEYCKRHGILTLLCHECGQLTAAFAIAKR